MTEQNKKIEKMNLMRNELILQTSLFNEETRERWSELEVKVDTFNSKIENGVSFEIDERAQNNLEQKQLVDEIVQGYEEIMIRI